MGTITRKLVVLAPLSLLCAGAVSAYVLLSPKRTWDSPPTYIVDQRGMASIADGDGGATRTVNALTANVAWNGAGSGTVIHAQKGSVASWQLGDGVPMLNFSDPEHVCAGSCLAATFTGFYEGRGDGTTRIVDADIVTNTRYAWTSEGETDGCSGEFYIEGVQVHEAGHGLGLGHTDVSGATMYPSVASCNNGPASTAADDEAGLNALYSGGGGGGGGGCTLLPKGASCTANDQCCSGSCKGRTGRKTCK